MIVASANLIHCRPLVFIKLELFLVLLVSSLGKNLINVLPCRWFDWDLKRAEKLSLGLRPSERVLEPLEDVGQQLALTFNNDGSLLAVGGEVGISPYTISG